MADDPKSKCPFSGSQRGPRNANWWPNQLDISGLHDNSTKSDPMGGSFNYPKEFESLDLDAVIKDLATL